MKLRIAWGLTLLLVACDGKDATRREPPPGPQPRQAQPSDAEKTAGGDAKAAGAAAGLGGLVAGKVAEAQPAQAPPAAAAAANKVESAGPVESRMAEPTGAPADVAAAPASAIVTASGLAYQVLTPGTIEASPGPHDKVEVHYTGWTTDGKEFDSSVRRGRTAKFGVDKVIAGWTEVLQLMKVGETVRVWIPTELAYQGKPGRPAGMLVFDIELLGFEGVPPPPETPPDVAAIPADATVTASGIGYRVLTPGTGAKHPGATDQVEVNYTGWTTDGKMFDSSVTRGRTATFPLNRVIPGWTEGVQLMVEGETTRFWIPENLAYEGKPGRPQGMLVFDIQLVSIK